MDIKKVCPCCNRHYFEETNYYESCPVCGWIDDLVQRDDPNYWGGANDLSLNDYRAKWEKNRQSA